MDRFDLVVIGSGPAGEKGAAQAAYFGKRVAVVERESEVGGAGINTGTMPSKTLRESALYFSGLRQRGLFGIDYSLKEGLTVADFMFREQLVVAAERRQVARNLDRHGIELVRGVASFSDAHTVRVDVPDGGVRDLHADIVLIATGSSPHHPPGIPFEHRRVHDSDEILFQMDRIPETMAVVGGGVVGMEYASIFTALGVRVTLIDSRAELLPFVDREIVGRLHARLENLGLCLLLEEQVTHVHPDDAAVHLRLDRSGMLDYEIALWAAGRVSNTAGLGLEPLGVTLGQRGLIVVNEQYQTSVPHIYAAGDVIGFPALASASMEQARVAMVHAFNLGYKQRVSPVLPLSVYAIPELSMAGLTEEACREQGVDYLTGRATYDMNPRGQIIGDSSGMLKLIFAPTDKRLLGVHLIGEGASELVHIGAQALADGSTIDTFIDAVYNYPSLSDLYKYAAYDGLGALQRFQA